MSISSGALPLQLLVEGKARHHPTHLLLLTHKAEILIGNFRLFCIVINRLDVLISEAAGMLLQLFYCSILNPTLLTHGLLHDFIISCQILPFAAPAPWMFILFHFLVLLILSSNCCLPHRQLSGCSCTSRWLQNSIFWRAYKNCPYGFLYFSVLNVVIKS